VGKKKPIVFVETSIPSFYFTERTGAVMRSWRDVTRWWWDEQRHGFHLVTSEVVLVELASTPRGKSEKMLELMREVEILPEPEGLEDLVEFYLSNRLMPRDNPADASHLAYASLCGAGFLLTWNCKHLANADKFRQIRTLNARRGLAMPVLLTPSMIRSVE
jgi:hypothetical protein